MIAAKELPRFVGDLLASPPRRGDRMNNWLYRVARVLHPYREAGEIVATLQAATAGENVRAGEIERAVERSKETAWQPGETVPVVRAETWPTINAGQREAVAASGAGLVDLWEASPIRFEDGDSHAEEIIDALFPNDPLLCVGRDAFTFATRHRAAWGGRLAGMQFVVPSPMAAQTGLTQDGKESEHTLANTGPEEVRA